MFREPAQLPRLENISVRVVCFLLFCTDEADEGDTCVQTGLFLRDFHSTWLLALFPVLCPSNFCLEECGIQALFLSCFSSPGLVLLLDGGLLFSLSKQQSAEPFLRSTVLSRFSSFCRWSASLLSSSSCSIRFLKTSSCSASSCRKTEPWGGDGVGGELQGFLQVTGSSSSLSTLFLLEQILVLLHVSKSCLQVSGSERDVEGLLLESKKCSSVSEGPTEVDAFRMFS